MKCAYEKLALQHYNEIDATRSSSCQVYNVKCAMEASRRMEEARAPQKKRKIRTTEFPSRAQE